MIANILHLFVRLTLIILIPAMVAYSTYLFARGAFVEPVAPGDNSIKFVQITPGTSFREICRLLETEGLINHWWSLDIIAKLQKNDTKIQAGEYALTPSMKPTEILTHLISGKVFKRKITAKEGATIWEISKLIEQAGLSGAEEFNRALTDPELLARAGIDAPSFEGYLFPETYHFTRPITPKQIIWAMLEEGEKHWPEDGDRLAEALGMTRHEVLTLASIVEKESGNAEEQPLIASVLHNRLRQGMRLQTDPAVIYGVPNFDGNLTKEHLLTPSPYNTYLNFGLPPGPIANPGETAIKASLNPPETEFLFFVADGRGGHIFSTTLKEHNEAVRRYQLERVVEPPAAGAPAE